MADMAQIMEKGKISWHDMFWIGLHDLV